ncbi:uroporphyrinogen decarboxylase/cobalamine-independent methonine synthase family protein [Zophobihabitans entericus]|uniref:Uncharacterized protein n=1 Tax=Zophobihabitans entericus TaxID=1635327 RepID=A0A6G9I9L0_9GAMM|nr:hypothetical protein [Zophobihabitans entericus]QIQ20903.1 hypothetical protein IPMB12_03920 [Zophobihabitans entericus]
MTYSAEQRALYEFSGHVNMIPEKFTFKIIDQILKKKPRSTEKTQVSCCLITEHQYFLTHLIGIEQTTTQASTYEDLQLQARLDFDGRHPCLTDYFTENKYSIKSNSYKLPSLTLFLSSHFNHVGIYHSFDQFCNELVSVYIKVILGFYRAGCRKLYLEELLLSQIAEHLNILDYEWDEKIERLCHTALNTLRQVLQHKPQDLEITLRLSASHPLILSEIQKISHLTDYIVQK